MYPDRSTCGAIPSFPYARLLKVTEQKGHRPPFQQGQLPRLSRPVHLRVRIDLAIVLADTRTGPHRDQLPDQVTDGRSDGNGAREQPCRDQAVADVGPTATGARSVSAQQRHQPSGSRHPYEGIVAPSGSSLPSGAADTR